jgi:hypothetical protein
MYRHKKWTVITFRYFFVIIRTVLYGQLRYITIIIISTISLLKPLSHCEPRVPPVATIQRCLYLQALHTHRSCSQQFLKISTLQYGLYDRKTTVRFSVRVAFLFSTAGRSTLAPIRPHTQRMQRTYFPGDEDGA